MDTIFSFLNIMFTHILKHIFNSLSLLIIAQRKESRTYFMFFQGLSIAKMIMK